MSAAEGPDDANQSTGSKEVVVDKTEKEGEEPNIPRSDRNSEGNDQRPVFSAVAVNKGKDATSSEIKLTGGQEVAAMAAPTFNYLQAQPQQQYVQYVPPYQAIVRGLSGGVAEIKKTEPEVINANYRDYANVSDPAPDGRNRGGVMEVFPVKLHRMLRQSEYEGKADIVSFCPHGRAFNIHKPKRFEAEIMTRYFRQSRVQSFQRQLNLYGFKRITRGPDTGGYYHERFLRGRPGLCVNMQRTRIKGAPKQAENPDSEPDFYSLPQLPDAGSSFPQHIPMHQMVTPHMFPPYMYPMPPGVAGPYTIAQTHPPGLHPFAAAQFGKIGAVQMMSPPFGAIPFPFGMFPPQPGQEKVSPENTSQDGEMKSPEAEAEEKTENVDAILDDPDVSQHADV